MCLGETRSSKNGVFFVCHSTLTHWLAKSEDWQAEQRRIRDEANRARAEARAEQPAPNPHGTNQHTKERLVDPQLEGQPTNTDSPEPEPKPKRDHAKKQAKAASTAKAAKIGVSRAAVFAEGSF